MKIYGFKAQKYRSFIWCIVLAVIHQKYIKLRLKEIHKHHIKEAMYRRKVFKEITNIELWIFLTLFCTYIFDTGSVFLLNRALILLVTTHFARSSTMASSGVRENVYPNNKLENFILNEII